jgi:hypothetical protein
MELAPTILEASVSGGALLKYSGRYFRNPSGDELREIARLAVSLAARARGSNGLAEGDIPDLCEFAFVPVSNEAALEVWGAARSLKAGEVRGPSFAAKASLRLGRALSAKMPQLPRDAPGVVVVNYSLVRPGEDAHQSQLGDRSMIVDLMLRYPSLLATIVCGRIAGHWPTDELPARLPPFVRPATRWPFPNFTFQYEIIWNRAFELPRPVDVLRTMYRGLRTHHRFVHANRHLYCVESAS